MNYSSTETIQSTLYQGVSFTLRKRSQKRRADFNLAMAPITRKLRELEAEGAKAEDQACACGHKVSKHSFITGDCSETDCPCKSARGENFEARDRVLVELNRIDRDEVQPERIRRFVKSIEGFDIDGSPATVDSLISDGPDDLLDEIDDQIRRLLGLTPGEQKNSLSPGTSGAPAEAMNDSTAPSASAAETTADATATATSPS